MNTLLTREPHHGSLKLAALVLPALLMIGCESGVSGHAPGLAGVQTQDPGTLNFPLAYVKRPAPASTPTADIDVRDLITSTTGGDLYIRAQASPGSVETNVTGSITKGMGDVRDLDVSPDGKKLVFSLRLPLNPNKPNTDVTQPNWKIYQYDAVAKTVTVAGTWARVLAGSVPNSRPAMTGASKKRRSMAVGTSETGRPWSAPARVGLATGQASFPAAAVT